MSVPEPAITVAADAAKVYHPGTQTPTFIVFHDVEAPCVPGKAADVAHYFAGLDGVTPGGVAHYTVDPAGMAHSVPEGQSCAHCGEPGNFGSVGIEMAGYETDNWMDDAHVACWKRAADLGREVADRHGIPLTYLSADALRAGKRHGYTFHKDVTGGLGGTTHQDPGANFPYEAFGAYLEGAAPLAVITHPPVASTSWTDRVSSPDGVLNVRATPGGAISTTFATGARVRRLGGSSNGWVWVEGEGGSIGWVADKYLTPIVAPVPTAPPAPAAPAPAMTHKVVNCDFLNVRTGPQGSIYTTWKAGTGMFLLGPSSGGFVKVQGESGTQGWVNDQYITKL